MRKIRENFYPIMLNIKKELLIKIISCVIVIAFLSSDAVYSMSLRLPVGNISLERAAEIINTQSDSGIRVTIASSDKNIDYGRVKRSLGSAKKIQIYGQSIEGQEFNESYSETLREIIPELPDNLKVLLINQDPKKKNESDSPWGRMVHYEENGSDIRWIFAHAVMSKGSIYLYLPEVAFMELSKTFSGRKFLAELITYVTQQPDILTMSECPVVLKRFIIDYVGDGLYSKEIRKTLHIIDSINKRIPQLDSLMGGLDNILDKMRSSESKAEIINLLKDLEVKLKKVTRIEKREALEIISSVREEMEKGDSINPKSRLIHARSVLNRYLEVLFEQNYRYKQRLERSEVYYAKRLKSFDKYSASGGKQSDDEAKSALTDEFENWISTADGQEADLYGKVFKFYRIWYSRGERSPPRLAELMDIIKDNRLKEMVKLIEKRCRETRYKKFIPVEDEKIKEAINKVNGKLIRKTYKTFDELTAYEKYKFIAKNEDMSGKNDLKLLRLVAFTPNFYWGERVPKQVREHISTLYSCGRFGVDFLDAKSCININYTEKAPDKYDISRYENRKPVYWSRPPKEDLCRMLSDFTGNPVSYFKNIWDKDKEDNKKNRKNQKMLYAIYRNYRETGILQDYIWNNEKQTYSIKWEDNLKNKHEGNWMITKDPLRDIPVSFVKKQEAPSDIWTPVKELNNAILVNEATGRIRFNEKGKVCIVPEFTLLGERHGETQTNTIATMFQGQVDEDINQLNDKGKEQARKGAEILLDVLKEKIVSGEGIILITSEFGRAKETAKFFTELVKEKIGVVIEPVEEKLANEKSYGIWDNKDSEKFSAEQQALALRYRKGLDAALRPERGESFLDLLIRTKELLDKLNRLYKGKTIVIISHGVQLRAIQALLGDRSLVDETGQIDWRRKMIGNGEVALLWNTDNLESMDRKEKIEKIVDRLKTVQSAL